MFILLPVGEYMQGFFGSGTVRNMLGCQGARQAGATGVDLAPYAFRPRAMVLAVGLVFAVLAGACGDRSPSRQGAIPDWWLEQIEQNVPAEQQELLADGTLTFAEYEEAVFANLACLEALGFRIVDGPLVEVPFETYFYGVAVPANANRTMLAGAEECWRTYSEWIEATWSLVNPVDVTILQEINEFFADCLERSGIHLGTESTSASGGPEDDLSGDRGPVVSRCRTETEIAFQFRRWRS